MIKRKHLLTIALSALFAAPAFAADRYTFDPNHSQIRMQHTHFGFSNPQISFQKFDGELALDTQDWSKSSVSVTIPVDSLYSGVDKFTDHLKSPDFFDVAKFPTASFKSTAVAPAGEGKLKVDGDLTLHGVTKPVSLDVTINKVGESPGGKGGTTAGFDASTTIKRSDFGLGLYAPNVSDEIRIEITTETHKEEAKAEAES